MKVTSLLWINLAICCIGAVQGENESNKNGELNLADEVDSESVSRVVRGAPNQRQQGRKLVRFTEKGEEEVKYSAEAFFPDIQKSGSGSAEEFNDKLSDAGSGRRGNKYAQYSGESNRRGSGSRRKVKKFKRGGKASRRRGSYRRGHRDEGY